MIVLLSVSLYLIILKPYELQIKWISVIFRSVQKKTSYQHNDFGSEIVMFGISVQYLVVHSTKKCHQAEWLQTNTVVALNSSCVLTCCGTGIVPVIENRLSLTVTIDIRDMI